MATTVTGVAKDGRKVLNKIFVALGKGNLAKVTQRIWLCGSSAPTIDAGASTCATYPVAVGDLAYRSTGIPYVCTVAPAAATAATFVALKA